MAFCVRACLALLFCCTTIFSMETPRNCIIQCSDQQEIPIDMSIVECIPVIHDCWQGTQHNELVPLPIKSSQWYHLDKFLKRYKELWEINAAKVYFDPEKIIHYDEHSFAYKSVEEFEQKQQEKKNHKIYELYEQTALMSVNDLIDLFQNVEYLEMVPLNQIILARVITCLENRDIFEEFVKQAKKEVFSPDVKNYLIQAIMALENKKGQQTYKFHIKNDGPGRYIYDYVATRNKDIILKIGTGSGFYSTNLQIGYMRFSKPKVSLFQTNITYDFNEVLFLRCFKKEWQKKYLQKAYANPSSVPRKYPIILCRHSPEMVAIYLSLLQKNNSAVKEIIDYTNCDECYKVSNRLSKDFVSILNKKVIFTGIGVISGIGLMVGLYKKFY